ncbi:hypothetical protein M2150_000927 [Lachnospiraceae bacterium PM6-15]|uniref:right-handed parallel beta-helix repeat-containing protein n=1 Tax=Ohessyouella blattaphilus TaxID=2949333 RepID=UPI003E300227
MRKKVLFLLFLAGFSLLQIRTDVEAAPKTYEVATYQGLVDVMGKVSDGDVININDDIVVDDTINLSKSVTIQGNDNWIRVPEPGLHDSGILNGKASRFRVFSAQASGKEIAISNLKISGGSAQGGAIYIGSNVVVSLNQVTITNSGGSGYSGGGIYNRGKTYITDSVINRNGASYGGGFLNNSGATMVIENSSMSENRSLSSSGGGGAAENQGQLYVNNCTFANNKSTELGGAINDYQGMAYIMNSTFSGNVTYSTSYDGGALRGRASVVVNCLFAYNYRLFGGAYILDDYAEGYGNFGSSMEDYRVVNSVVHENNNRIVGYNKIQYEGASDGSDNTIFSGGIVTKVLNANGAETGTGTVFQPYNYQPTGASTAVPALKSPMADCLTKGLPTVFDPYAKTPVFAYRNSEDGQWYSNNNGMWSQSALTDETAEVVATDQVGEARSGEIGSTVFSTTGLYMVKLIHNPDTAHGLVHGATVYGDVYKAGDKVEIITTPDTGYCFEEWVHTDGSNYSTTNPLRFVVTEDVIISPAYQEITDPQTPTDLEINAEKDEDGAFTIEATLISEGNVSGQAITFYVCDESGKIIYSETLPTGENGKVKFQKWLAPDEAVYKAFVSFPGSTDEGSSISDNITLSKKLKPVDIEWVDTVEIEYGTPWSEVEVTGEKAGVDGEFSFAEEPAGFGAVDTYEVTRTFTPEDLAFQSYTHEMQVVVVKKPLATSMIADLSDYTYTGSAVTPIPVVTDGEPSLISSSDYMVSYTDNEKAGEATLTITATESGNYTGTAIKTFTIKQKALSDEMIAYIEDVVATGAEVKPMITVTDGVNSSITTADYTVEYTNNTDTGVAMVTIKATTEGNYSGSASRTFLILPSEKSAGLTSVTKTYDGADHTVSFGPEDNLCFSEDYAAIASALNSDLDSLKKEPRSFKKAGIYTEYYCVLRDGVVSEWGSVGITITRKELTAEMIGEIESLEYTGEALSPSVTVTDGDPSSISASDYEVTYLNNVNIGLGKVIIQANSDGNYYGTVEKEFTIMVKSQEVNTDGYTGEYDGQEHSISVVPEDGTIYYSLNENELSADDTTEFSMVNPTFVAAGTYTVFFRVDCENYVTVFGSETIVIEKKPLTKDMFQGIPDQEYIGQGVAPNLSVKEALLQASDYTVGYANNVNEGTAEVVITATEEGNFSGTVTLPFKITKKQTIENAADNGNSVAGKIENIVASGDGATFVALILLLLSLVSMFSVLLYRKINR